MLKPEESRHGKFLELFFDLVPSSRSPSSRAGWSRISDGSAPFRRSYLLLAIWSVWSVTAWVTDLHDPRHLSIQMPATDTMLGALVMAVTLQRTSRT